MHFYVILSTRTRQVANSLHLELHSWKHVCFICAAVQHLVIFVLDAVYRYSYLLNYLLSAAVSFFLIIIVDGKCWQLCFLLMYLDQSSARTSAQADSSLGNSEQEVENDAPVGGSTVGLYLDICAHFMHVHKLNVWLLFAGHTLLKWLLLIASLYDSKIGAYWDRLCCDVVGWLSRACTVAKRCILGL